MLQRVRVLPLRAGTAAGGALYHAARSLGRAKAALASDTSEMMLDDLPRCNMTQLANGLRIVTQVTQGSTATVAVKIGTGSRYETQLNSGVATLLEHTMLKGTKKRNQSAIEREIEGLGGRLNVVTERDTTTLHTTTPAINAVKTLDLLADVLLNPLVAEDVLNAERDVILQQMRDTDEFDLQAVVMDGLHKSGYQGSSLAQSVLGTSANTMALTREDVLSYHRQNFAANRMVLSVAGNVDHQEIVKTVERLFGNMPTADIPALKTPRVIGSAITYRDDDMPLAHVGLAVEGVGYTSPDYIAMEVALMMLGQWNRSMHYGNNLASPLAQQCCEEHICESYAHFNHCHADTGLFGVYFVCDRMTVDDITHEALREWMRLAINPRDSDVERAKNKARFNVMAQADDTVSLANEMAKQVLVFGRRVPLDETVAKIDAVDRQTIRNVLRKHFYDRDPVVVGWGPVEALPDYNRIMSSMWWARF